MATRIAAKRFFQRRFSSGSGKVLGEEEKAAENIYIKRAERERLEKLAHKGPKPEETAAPSAGGSGTEAKPSSSAGESTAKVSSDKYRNYGVIAGTVTVFGALGWYFASGGKKQEVQE